jgi:hypothetical protein
MLRIVAVVVAGLLFGNGCTTRQWKSIAPETLPTLEPRPARRPLHLLVVGEEMAYELDFRLYDNGVLDGSIVRAWEVNAIFPVGVQTFNGESPAEIARKHRWNELPVTTMRGVPATNVVFATAGEDRLSAKKVATIGLIVGGTALVLGSVFMAYALGAFDDPEY